MILADIGAALIVSMLLFLGLLVARGGKNAVNILFASLCFVVSAWVGANFIATNHKTFIIAPTAIYLDLLLALIMAMNLVTFIVLFLRKNSLLSRKKSRIILTSSFALTLFAVVAVVSGNAISINLVDASYAITYKTTYFAYITVLAINIINALGLLIFALVRSVATLRQQVKFTLIGFFTAALLLMIGNIAIPLLTNNSTAVLLAGDLAYFGLFVFAVLSSYAIFKHQLFNIRVLLARSVAYTFTIGIIVGLYTLIAFGLTTALFQFDISISMEFFLAGLTIVAAIGFQPVKRFFDKFSNKIFYRDAYDAQGLLNDINSSIVSTTNLLKLLEVTTRAIRDNIKASFCNFYIDSKTVLDFHNVGTNNALFNSEKWESLLKALELSKAKIFSEEQKINEHTAQLMHDLNIDVVLRLTSQDQNVGYLVVGQKQSGSSFTNQDAQILEIIADEVAIAVQNTLRYEEIASFNLTLQGKIKAATAELEHNNQKLRQLDEAKDEFISMASHQLRTPLTSVKGYISMLLEGDAGKLNEQQRKFLDQAFISSQRMVFLISDLLNVSRLKTGKFVIEAKPTYLPDVVEGEIAQLLETAKARGLELIYNKPKEFCTLNIDETKIRQVIMNFADNAIHYTPSGGKIVVELKQTDASVEFTVTDNGIGVPRAEVHKLFSKFYRAGNARKARPDGTGLGIFMAKKVVIAQCGAIIFKTEEGKGSIFGFTFPRAKLEVPPAAK